MLAERFSWGVAMELLVLIAVLIVAGSMIPANPGINFYR